MSDPPESPGFAEATPPYEAPPAEPAVAPRYKLTVGPGGRVVIPAEVRRALGIEEGTTLMTWVEDDEWHVITSLAAIRRVQAIAARYERPGESVVDEFLAERRAMWGEE